MKYFSHGPNSDLLEHSRQVACVATNREERIIALCHDVGKATERWQRYAASEFKDGSPHNHAKFGGLLSSVILRELHADTHWPVVAIHVGSAHHSLLKRIKRSSLEAEVSAVVDSRSARDFFLSLFAEEHGLTEQLSLPRCWERVGEIDMPQSDFWDSWIEGLSQLSSSDILHILFTARDLLGRIVIADHASAAYQSRAEKDFAVPVYVDLPFSPRKARQFACSNRELSQLRGMLKTEAVELATSEANVFLVVAPTGLGKTEAMLSLGESLCDRNQLKRIVYAVPQVSLGDQVFADYLDGQVPNAQIWNYTRRERTFSVNPTEKNVPDDLEYSNLDRAVDTSVAENAFALPYNVTTFNQVLFGLCHPHRLKCATAGDLRNAVVILDEFHKLPFHVVPFFFELAMEVAKHRNCRFVLGSATPYPIDSYCPSPSFVSLPPSVTQNLFEAPIVESRRKYRRAPEMEVESLAEYVEAAFNERKSSLLAVVNLVYKGSNRLREIFGLPLDPWKRLEHLDSSGRLVLDGTVPSCLRESYIRAVSQRLKSARPTLLISTQMIEVGVDFDFDHGIIDYQGLASVLQRGGRVGRESRADGIPRTVEVFRLMTDDRSSEECLEEIARTNGEIRALPAFTMLERVRQKIRLNEGQFLEQWEIGTFKTESELLKTLESSLRNIDPVTSHPTLRDILSPSAIDSGTLGLHFEYLQLLVDLYGSEGDPADVYLFNTLQELGELTSELNASRYVSRELALRVQTHKIQTFNRKIIGQFEEEMIRSGSLLGGPVFVSSRGSNLI